MRRWFVAALLIAIAAGGSTASAQTPQPTTSSESAACPGGNLLAGKPLSTAGAIRTPGKTHDNIAAPEGAFWNVGLAAVLDSTAASLTWDLGAPTKLGVTWIQADANDYYMVSVSTDGANFTDIGRIGPVDGDGLRARTLWIPQGTVARYFRIGGATGDNFYSISEAQLFCDTPVPFPPRLRVDPAPLAKQADRPFWNDQTSARWEFALSVLGLLLLLWRPGFVAKPSASPSPDGPRPWHNRLVGFLATLPRRLGAAAVRAGSVITFLGLRPKPLAKDAPTAVRVSFLKRLRARLLVGLGLLAALTYINFFHFHFGNFIHDWEWTHYYVGSKYFKELSYDRLYECIAIADVEDGLRKRVELRKLTNLRTNLLESSKDVVAHPERCKQHFSEDRWTAFKKDVAFFRNRQTPQRWDDLQTDHGYNATPVWNVAGTMLSNLGPATTKQLYSLAMFDMVYLFGTYALIWWAFGWRALCVALLVFATNFPSRFYWTGGAFLRWDWLFYLVASVCCLRKNRPMLGGAALAYSTLLRVFPLFIFIGPFLGIVQYFLKHRRLEPRYLRFFVGAALATAFLVPVSLAVSGGVHGYRRFVENTMKHKETPLTNYMGLRTVVAYRPLEAGRFLKDDKLTDPWVKWKTARVDAWKEARPVYVALVLAFIFILGLATRHVEPWVAAALGITLIPIGVELTCYYYAFIIGVAVLWTEREEVGRWLLFLTGYTQFAAWAPLMGMPTWLDEQYTYMSFATIAVFAAVVLVFRRPTAPEALPVGPSRIPSSGLLRSATPGLASGVEFASDAPAAPASPRSKKPQRK
ncbi:MAG TPA: discoidin domain-containing protein [Polyangia bacterium]